MNIYIYICVSTNLHICWKLDILYSLKNTLYCNIYIYIYIYIYIHYSKYIDFKFLIT